MKILCCFTLFVALFIPKDALYAQGGQNEWKYSATILEDSIDIPLLVFADPLHGYICGVKPYHPTYKEGIFYRTIDGGLTWQKVDLARVFGGDTIFYDNGPGGTFFMRFGGAPSSRACFLHNVGGRLSTSNDTLSFYWSTDNGSSWIRQRTSPITDANAFDIEGTLNDHEIIALKIRGGNDGSGGKFYYSKNSGQSFDDVRWDSVLLKNISTFGFGTQGTFNHVNNHSFDRFDDSSWIIIVSDSNNSYREDASKAYSLVTLLSHDAGHHWQAYRNNIPYYPSSSENKYFVMQCVRGTPYVYLFDSHNEGYFGDRRLTNFLYSSDYGVTWNIDRSFKSNRLAYEASAPNEVWCTITPNDDQNPNTPANWIAHTTNNGASWNIDKSSLMNDAIYSGRVITFSDKDHGWMLTQTQTKKGLFIFSYNRQNNKVFDSQFLFSPKGIYVTVNPNPAENAVTIRLKNNLEIRGIEVYDIFGRKQTLPSAFADNKTSVTLDTKELPAGCYMAHVSHAYGSYIAPFIIRR